ncbi:MAG: hypothetical protein ACYCS8_08145 [Acidithiobacillus sp.]
MSAETPSAADMVAQARQGIAPSFPRGAVPAAEETAKARKDAQGVLGWLRANLAKHRASADVARDLEDLLFNIGSIRMLWALMPDEDAAGRYLVEREALSSQAPFEVRRAFAYAERREHEERAALLDATFSLSQAAEKLQSARLREAVNVMQSMAGFFRVEPDGPAKAAPRNTGRAGGKKRAAPREKTRIAMIAEYRKLRPTGAYPASFELSHKYKEQALSDGWEVKAKNPAAQLYKWFVEADKITL